MKLLVLTVLTLVAFSQVTHGYKRMCYYANWRVWRPNYAKFVPNSETIPADLCTHIIYAFAQISGGVIAQTDSSSDTGATYDGYAKITGLKNINPKLKVIIAVGGATKSGPFSAMAASSSARSRFIQSAIAFCEQYGFDGMDYDWEFPGAGDRDNFVKLLEETHTAFKAKGLELSAAVSGGKTKLDAGFDIARIAPNVDFINLMAYDLHGPWDPTTGHNAGLYANSGETGNAATLNVKWAAEKWISDGLPKEKLIIGVAAYGHTWQLTTSNKGVGAPARSPSVGGQYTEAPGMLAYFEVCENVKNGQWDDEAKVPYGVYQNNIWVSYDDPQSIKIKTDWIKQEGYGGGMVWTLNDDDFKGDKCGKKYPIISVLKDNLPDGDDHETTTAGAATTTAGAATTTAGAATTTTGAGTTTTTGGAGTTTTAAAGTTTTTSAQQTTTAPPSGGGSPCNGRTGFFADPADCSRYYQCWSGGEQMFNCPPGLKFDNARTTCDHAYNVSC